MKQLKPFNEHEPKTEYECNIGDYLLHGDVILERISNLPEDFNNGATEPMNALAYGEATGHIHQLQGTPGRDFDLRINGKGERHLRVVNPVFLKHQEHSPILLKEGNYKVGIQQEYDPFEKLTRKVQD
jgi:hypothetical protein